MSTCSIQSIVQKHSAITNFSRPTHGPHYSQYGQQLYPQDCQLYLSSHFPRSPHFPQRCQHVLQYGHEHHFQRPIFTQHNNYRPVYLYQDRLLYAPYASTFLPSHQGEQRGRHPFQCHHTRPNASHIDLSRTPHQPKGATYVRQVLSRKGFGQRRPMFRQQGRHSIPSLSN